MRQKWSDEMTCPDCGALVEFDESDLKVPSAWGQADQHHFRLICPVTGCGTKMQIESRAVPRLIRERVVEAYQAKKR